MSHAQAHQRPSSKGRRAPKSQALTLPFLLFLFLHAVEVLCSGCTFNVHKADMSHSSAGDDAQLPQSDPFSLAECACEPDWADAFCDRVAIYQEMPAQRAPSVCVCRQLTGPRKCRQFLSRCFRRPSSREAQQHQSAGQIQRPLAQEEECSCCFNQPDPFCTQLGCRQMRPHFDGQANTTCRCSVPSPPVEGQQPSNDGLYPVEDICTGSSNSQHWPRRIGSAGSGDDLDPSSLIFSKESASSTSGVPHSESSGLLASLFRSSAPYARLVSLLLMALLASLLLAVAVCFWSHWQRSRRKGKVEAEEEGEQATNQQQRAMAGGEAANIENGALLQEATV